jgi:hypothetical protein
MSSSDLWQEGQYDPELRAKLAQWAPKGPSGRRAAEFTRSRELGQLTVAFEDCARLA